MLTTRVNFRNHVAWVILFLVYAAIAFFNLYKGSIQSPDTGQYIKWAKTLIGHEFSFLAYYSDVNFHVSPILYTIPVAIFAILISILGEHWVIAYQSLNLVALFFILFFYVKITLYLNVRQLIPKSYMVNVLGRNVCPDEFSDCDNLRNTLDGAEVACHQIWCAFPVGDMVYPHQRAIGEYIFQQLRFLRCSKNTMLSRVIMPGKSGHKENDGLDIQI
jgi:hypothetical protein